MFCLISVLATLSRRPVLRKKTTHCDTMVSVKPPPDFKFNNVSILMAVISFWVFALFKVPFIDLVFSAAFALVLLKLNATRYEWNNMGL